MTYGATDIASIRGDLVRWYASGYAEQLWKALGETQTWGGDAGPRVRDNKDAQTLRQQEAMRIGRGDLYFVSADMLALARQAARSLPAFDLQMEDLPSPFGMMLFDGCLSPARDERPDGKYREAPRPLVTWGPSMNFTGREPSVWLSVYSDLSSFERPPWIPRFNYDGEMLWPFGEMDDIRRRAGVEGEIPDSAQIRDWPAIVKTTWVLMQQPIVTTSAPETTRSERRRLARQDIDADAIRVVRLRRRSLVSVNNGDGVGREYSHQWMVRGHWRQQWYPSRNQHRPVWVTPHIKGPEGAPILGGERIHAWTR